MIPEKHYLLTSLAGIMCGFFLESDSLSLLNVNLKVDVDEITVIDQSYPVSKLIKLVLSILNRSQTESRVHSLQKLHIIVFSLGSPKKPLKSMALDAEPAYCAFIDCSIIRLDKCPVTCGTYEPRWCKRTADCKNPGASQICPVTCPRARKYSLKAQISKSCMKLFIITFH